MAFYSLRRVFRPRQCGVPSAEGLEHRRFLAATPAGTEFRLNEVTTNNQLASTVGMDAAGNFVVVWTSIGQDGNADGIFARRYDAGGAPLGGEFQVNMYT